MPRAAVLGNPVAHSLSPVIHNAGYAAAGLTGWSYTAIECAGAELADLVAGLGPEWAGLSLTMPLKEVAPAVADEVAPVVAAIGAANTLLRRPDGSWYAENTDVPGMVAALRTVGMVTAGTVAVLGAGGTARAALAAARRLGASAVTVYARRAEAIAELRPSAEALALDVSGADWAMAHRAAAADLVISTVPRGAADPLTATARWQPPTVLFDVAYDPWPTTLAASAAAAGCRVVSGLELLLAQALGQFELFTGVPAPAPGMRAALASARRPPR